MFFPQTLVLMSAQKPQRSEGQKLVPIPMGEELIAAIDKGRAKTGHVRSQFIRLAAAEKLAALGIHVAMEHVNPPERTGKGGSPSHKKPAKRSEKKDTKARAYGGDHIEMKAGMIGKVVGNVAMPAEPRTRRAR